MDARRLPDSRLRPFHFLAQAEGGEAQGYVEDEFYAGLEPSQQFREQRGRIDAGIFEVRPFGITANATPVLDEEVGAVIGYRASRDGVARIFDISGRQVYVDEVGLEKPAIDPIDILIGGFLVVSIRKVLFALARTRVGARSPTGVLNRTVIDQLRRVFRANRRGGLRFTQKTLNHMKNPRRYVPVHILRAAIKYGRKLPDSQSVQGTSMYIIAIRKNGKDYTLKIILRHSDNTIPHFHYFK